MLSNLYRFDRGSTMDLHWGQRIKPQLMYLSSGEDNAEHVNSEFFPVTHLFGALSFFASSNPERLGPKVILMNGGSSSLGEDPAGNFVEGWIPDKRNATLAKQIQDDYPRRMLHNLMLVGGADGNPMPIAGTYFVKMMDHTPGTVEPFSCVILDEDKSVDEFTIRGNLSLNNSEEGDTALNLLGKSNTIDGGEFGVQ